MACRHPFEVPIVDEEEMMRKLMTLAVAFALGLPLLGCPEPEREQPPTVEEPAPDTERRNDIPEEEPQPDIDREPEPTDPNAVDEDSEEV